MLELAAARGYEAFSLHELLDRAQLDEERFRRYFDGKRECFLWVFDVEIARFDEIMFAAYEAQPSWRRGLRAAAYAMADYIEANQDFVRYALVATADAGDLAQLQLDAVLQTYVELVDRGRQYLADPESVSRSAAEALVGSVFSLLRKRAAAGHIEEPWRLVPQFMYLALRPYLGDRVAREELTIPPPPNYP